MNDLKVFSSTEFGELGIMLIDGKEYFPATQCAKILGYTNPQKAIRDHCKQGVNETFSGVIFCDVNVKTGERVDGSPCMQVVKTKFINEGNLYRLIVSSKLPAAEKFESWVFDEVLPAIRKTGSYIPPEKPDSYLIEDPAERARRWAEEYEERKLLEDKIKEDEPKVTFANHVTESGDAIDICSLANLARKENIRIGRNRLFQWLRENKFLKDFAPHRNEPYQKYIDQGLFKVTEYTYGTSDGEKCGIKTYVTGKGQIFLINKLKKAFA